MINNYQYTWEEEIQLQLESGRGVDNDAKKTLFEDELIHNNNKIIT